MKRIAWIGLGAMGARMARRVSDAGYELVVWNDSRSHAKAFGADVAATPADAVREADVVVMMLADPAAVRDACDGMWDAFAAGTTIIDMSAIGPEAVAWLRDALPAGVTLLDARVLGSVSEAEAGTLQLLVGASNEAIAAHTPLLSVLGEPLHLGPTGTGAAAKLVANSALLSTITALGEAISLADGLGLPRDVTWRVLGLTPLADQAARRRPAIETGSYPLRFGLAMARKDADLIVAAATSTGRDVRLAQASRTWFAGAEEAGLGGQDYATVLGHILASGTTSTAGAASGATSTATAPHYQWGRGCDGWRLVDTGGLSVIEERMPPGTAETWHYHDHARQYFYVLDGQATMRTPDGKVVLEPGQGIQIAPGLPHQMANDSDGDLRFLAISAPTTQGDRTIYTSEQRSSHPSR